MWTSRTLTPRTRTRTRTLTLTLTLNAKPNPNPNPNQIEAKLLNGQKLQGTITAKDVATVLTSKGKEAEFPLFMRIHEIAFEGKHVSSIIDL